MANSLSVPLDQIDRDAYEPAYIQLAAILRKRIAGGDFRPGDQLPSEAQLCQRYGISPMTVRRTINLLSDQGVVSTAQGRGTFVRALELTTATFDLRELQELLDDTQNAEVRLLDVRVVLADERTARKLQLEPGAPTIYLRRLLSKAGRPVFYHRTYLLCDPTRPIVEAEMDVTSLQGLFSPTDQTLLKNGHLTIESTLMNAEEADLLHVSLPAAAFYLEHLFYDYQDQPVSWGWFIFPSSFLKFSACVGLHD